jgi:hypothetical protein
MLGTLVESAKYTGIEELAYVCNVQHVSGLSGRESRILSDFRHVVSNVRTRVRSVQFWSGVRGRLRRDSQPDQVPQCKRR